MLLHARLLDEVIGLFIRCAVEPFDDLFFDQLTQAFEGVVGFDAVGQRQQACAVDEGRQALDLEVEGGFLAVFARQHKLAETPHGRAIAQRVLGHHALEQTVVADLIENPAAQLRTAFSSPQTTRRSK
jgi:hypothetical protein